jgi:O-antigen/teichoic acid export membrane protein
VALFFFLGNYNPFLKSLICAYFFVDLIMNILLQVARGLALNFDYSISSIVGSILQMILTIVFVQNDENGLLMALLALLFSSMTQTIYLCIRIKLLQYIKIKLISKQTIKELVGYSWPMVPNNMSMWVMRVSDRFIVTAFMGSSANAVYSVANKIPNILSQLQGTFTMAWQENASIFATDDDINVYYSSMFKFIYNFMAGALGLLIASTPVLFKILIRGDYGAAYKQMSVLFYGMFFSCMASYLGGIYIAFKATKNVGVTTTVSAVLNVIIDLLLIKWAGLYAASVSTLLSYVFLFAFRLYDIKKLVELKYSVQHLLLVQLVLILECYISSKQIFFLNIVNIFVSVVAFIVLNYSFLSKIVSILNNKIKKSKGNSMNK